MPSWTPARNEALCANPEGETDLRSIAIYTEGRWGRDQRNLYLKQLDDAFLLLAENPQAGTECDDIRAGYRKFPQGSHVIFYRVAPDTLLEIVRVPHKSMDAESKLTGG